MAPYRIRPYEDSDYAAVRTLFTRGMREHAPTSYRHLLNSPPAQLFFLGLFLAVLAASGSLLLALGALLLALAGSWWHLHSLWAQYVQQSLASDLLDIRRTYLEAVDSCLWVAEADGTVLGMVAAVPLEKPSEGGTALELKRMSVGQEHRGRGIARALCGTVLRFARERGYGAVVLSTSLAQRAAQRLYESVGFRKQSEYFPSRLAQLLRFPVFCYRFELPDSD